MREAPLPPSVLAGTPWHMLVVLIAIREWFNNRRRPLLSNALQCNVLQCNALQCDDEEEKAWQREFFECQEEADAGGCSASKSSFFPVIVKTPFKASENAI